MARGANDDGLILAALGSGSKGNATYVGDGRTGVLIDCGLSTRQIRRRMAAVGLAEAPIDAVLVTHEHGDHVAAAAILARDHRRRTGRALPFYMTAGTRGALPARVVPEAVETVPAGASFEVGSLVVGCVPVPHDTADPVAWWVESAGRRAGVITDLGRPTSVVRALLGTLHACVLEFNHDLDMLLGGPYTWPLKQRVRSSHGHLSNEQAADLLAETLHPGLRHVLLGHLSEENNRPEVALVAAARVVEEAGAAGEVRLGLAPQREPAAPVRVGA